MSTRKLPQEIADSILDYLHDDRPVLLSLTVASPSWTYRARRHLAHNLLLFCASKDLESRTRSLISCMQKDPSLVRYVYSLTIIHDDLLSHEELANNPGYSMVCQVIKLFLNIQAFTFQNARLDRLPSDMTNVLTELLSLPSLVHLRLEMISADVSDDIWTLLSIPTSLITLELDYINFDVPWHSYGFPVDVEPYDILGKAHLRSLIIRDEINYQYLHSIINTELPHTGLNLSSLTHLALHETGKMWAVGRLLKLVGQSLEHLEINIHSEEKDAWNTEPIGVHLTHMPRLRRIDFLVGVSSLRTFDSLFKDLHTDHPLEHITIDFLESEKEVVLEMESYLLQSGLGSLKKVEITTSQPYLSRNGDALFRQAFPVLYEREVISLLEEV